MPRITFSFGPSYSYNKCNFGTYLRVENFGEEKFDSIDKKHAFSATSKSLQYIDEKKEKRVEISRDNIIK